MNRKLRNLALLALGLLAGNTALAETPEGLYFAAHLGQGTVDVSQDDLDTAVIASINAAVAPATVNGFASDLDDTVDIWAVQIGYRWNRYFASEIGFIDMGDTVYESTATTTNGNSFFADNRIGTFGPTASVLGIFPFLSDRLEVYGRGGVILSEVRSRYRLQNNATGALASAQATSSSWDLWAGIGGSWNINENIAVRGEFNLFLDVGDENHVPEQDITLFTLAIVFR